MISLSPHRVLLSLAVSISAAALPLFADGDMESDLTPNTTLFFETLTPSAESAAESELLTDLGKLFDHPLLMGKFEEKHLNRLFELAEKHPDSEAMVSPIVQAANQQDLHDIVMPRFLALAEKIPSSRELNLTAGELLIKDKRIDDAIPYFERAFEAVRLDPNPASPRRREYNANAASKLILIYSDKALDTKRRQDASLADENKLYLDKLRKLRLEAASIPAFDSAPQVRSALLISCIGDMELSGANSPLSVSVLIPFDNTAWRLRDEMRSIIKTTLEKSFENDKDVENPAFPAPFRILHDIGLDSEIMSSALLRAAEDPNDTQALLTIALTAAEQKDFLLSARAWERIFAVIKSPNSRMFAIFAQVQKEARLFDDAERSYRILASILNDPDTVNADLAMLAFERLRYREALRYFAKTPLTGERLVVEAECWIRLGDSRKALERIRNAARVAPVMANSREFRLVSANIADKAGDLKYVEDMLSPILDQDGRPDAEIYNTLGYIFATHDHKLSDAMRYLSRAVELEPENGAIADSYAWVLFKSGKLQEAKKEILRAIRLTGGDRLDAVILDHAGDIFHAVGEKDAAQDYWRRALCLDGDVDYDEIERKLNR